MSNVFTQYFPHILELNDSKLSEIGISIFDSDGSIRNILDIIGDLYDRWAEDLMEYIHERI